MICLLLLPLFQLSPKARGFVSGRLSCRFRGVGPRDEARGTVRRDQVGAIGAAPKPLLLFLLLWPISVVRLSRWPEALVRPGA